MGKRNTVIDLAKYIASIMIIAIHTGLFSDTDATLNFVVVHIICRLAVPFFAICTGYFLTSKLRLEEIPSNNRYNVKIFCRQWKKLILIYAIWSVLYLIYSIPSWIEIGWFSPLAFVDYAIATITKGSHYHFWYLWGMIYVLPIFYVLLHTLRQKYWTCVIVILWLVKVASYAYTMLIPKQVVAVIEKIGVISCLLPLLLIGALISFQKDRKQHFYVLGLILSVIGLTIEVFALRNMGQESVSYVVFTLPASYFLFTVITKIKIKGNRDVFNYFGSVSMFVYCVHPMIVELTDDVFQNSIAHFSLVAIGSTALGCGYHYVCMKKLRKKEK